MPRTRRSSQEEADNVSVIDVEYDTEYEDEVDWDLKISDDETKDDHDKNMEATQQNGKANEDMLSVDNKDETHLKDKLIERTCGCCKNPLYSGCVCLQCNQYMHISCFEEDEDQLERREASHGINVSFAGKPPKSCYCGKCKRMVNIGVQCIGCHKAFHSHCMTMLNCPHLNTQAVKRGGYCHKCPTLIKSGLKCLDCRRNYHEQCINLSDPCEHYFNVCVKLNNESCHVNPKSTNISFSMLRDAIKEEPIDMQECVKCNKTFHSDCLQLCDKSECDHSDTIDVENSMQVCSFPDCLHDLWKVSLKQLKTNKVETKEIKSPEKNSSRSTRYSMRNSENADNVPLELTPVRRKRRSKLEMKAAAEAAAAAAAAKENNTEAAAVDKTQDGQSCGPSEADNLQASQNDDANARAGKIEVTSMLGELSICVQNEKVVVEEEEEEKDDTHMSIKHLSAVIEDVHKTITNEIVMKESGNEVIEEIGDKVDEVLMENNDDKNDEDVEKAIDEDEGKNIEENEKEMEAIEDLCRKEGASNDEVTLEVGCEKPSEDVIMEENVLNADAEKQADEGASNEEVTMEVDSEKLSEDVRMEEVVLSVDTAKEAEVTTPIDDIAAEDVGSSETLSKETEKEIEPAAPTETIVIAEETVNNKDIAAQPLNTLDKVLDKPEEKLQESSNNIPTVLSDPKDSKDVPTKIAENVEVIPGTSKNIPMDVISLSDEENEIATGFGEKTIELAPPSNNETSSESTGQNPVSAERPKTPKPVASLAGKIKIVDISSIMKSSALKEESHQQVETKPIKQRRKSGDINIDLLKNRLKCKMTAKISPPQYHRQTCIFSRKRFEDKHFFEKSTEPSNNVSEAVVEKINVPETRSKNAKAAEEPTNNLQDKIMDHNDFQKAFERALYPNITGTESVKPPSIETKPLVDTKEKGELCAKCHHVPANPVKCPHCLLIFHPGCWNEAASSSDSCNHLANTKTISKPSVQTLDGDPMCQFCMKRVVMYLQCKYCEKIFHMSCMKRSLKVEGVDCYHRPSLETLCDKCSMYVGDNPLICSNCKKLYHGECFEKIVPQTNKCQHTSSYRLYEGEAPSNMAYSRANSKQPGVSKVIKIVAPPKPIALKAQNRLRMEQALSGYAFLSHGDQGLKRVFNFMLCNNELPIRSVDAYLTSFKELEINIAKCPEYQKRACVKLLTEYINTWPVWKKAIHTEYELYLQMRENYKVKRETSKVLMDDWKSTPEHQIFLIDKRDWYTKFFAYLKEKFANVMPLLSVVDDSQLASEAAEAPLYAVCVEGPPRNLNSIVFTLEGKNVTLKQHSDKPFNGTRNFKQFMNHPYVSITLQLADIDLKRSNVHEYDRFIMKGGVNIDLPDPEHIYCMKKINNDQPVHVYTYSYFSKYFHQLEEMMRNNTEILVTRREEIRALLKEFLLDLTEIKMKNNMATNTTVCYGIGCNKYIRSKQTTMKDINFWEVLTPKVELSLKKFTPQQDCHSKRITFTTLNKYSVLTASFAKEVNNAVLLYDCSMCNKSYLTYNGIHGHFMEVHREENAVICWKCGESVEINELTNNRWRHGCSK